MNDTLRAILVSEEQRNWLRSYISAHREQAREAFGYDDVEEGYWDAVADRLAAFLPDDAAADQPRIQWCVEHGREPRYWDVDRTPGPRGFCTKDCRVVSAIVVPLPDDAA